MAACSRPTMRDGNAAMRFIQHLFWVRELLVELPSFAFHSLFWWLYPTTILRHKAAICPYPRARRLMLRRSGIRVGHKVETNFGVLVVGRGKNPPAVQLGDRVALGPYVTFVASSYPDHSRLLNHPDLKGAVKRFLPIRVDEDAWIGAGAILMPGVVIGRSAVVGAGAIVTRDVAPFSVVAGVPAKVIRVIGKDRRDADEA